MAAPTTVERLIHADTGLTRSFAAAAAGLLGTWVWALFLAGPDLGEPRLLGLGIAVGVVQIAAYVWYAVAAGRAAGALGDSRAAFMVWILAAPFVALLPIPIVSTLIAASPLAVKFLLGGRLQTAIREASFADLHAPA